MEYVGLRIFNYLMYGDLRLGLMIFFFFVKVKVFERLYFNLLSVLPIFFFYNRMQEKSFENLTMSHETRVLLGKEKLLFTGEFIPPVPCSKGERV